MEKILNTPNLQCDDTTVILMALDLYADANLDFIYAYHAYYLRDRGLTRITTYDRRHFARAQWLEVAEP